MKREVIQDFLNLPGIAGVALMDGRSRPYFCGVDQTLNFQQKEALAQGILQVVETIPDGFDAFEFQFTEHQVRLYKLDRGMVLLVLTRPSLVYADYLGSIKQLKTVLREDIPNAIATFRLIAGNITLSGLNDRKHTNNSPTSADGTTGTEGEGQTTRFAAPPLEAVTPPSRLDPLPGHPTEALLAASDSTTLELATLKEAIAALNHLSQFTTQYLGTHVITNYWKATRPQADWLANIQIDRSAQLSFTGSSPQATLTPLTPQEQQWLQAWVSAFTKRCAQVIRDFPTIVEQKALNDRQKALLLAPKP
jgi:hypothetical protein